MKPIFLILSLTLITACSQSSHLNVFVECDTDNGGEISISFSNQNGSFDQMYQSTLATVCSTHVVKVENYSTGQDVKVVRTLDDGSTKELLSKAHEHILSDPADDFAGYSVDVRFNATSPYIEHGSL